MEASHLGRHITFFTYCKEEFEHFAVKLINAPVHCEGLLDALQCSDAIKMIILFFRLAVAMSLNVNERDIFQIVKDTICWLLYLKYCTLNI